MTRPSYAQIDLDAIRHNLRVTSSLAPSSKLLAVVKADAYGHGLVTVARAAASMVSGFAVASVDEALMLRKAGIKVPIVILEGPVSSNEVELASTNDFSLVIAEPEQEQHIAQAQITQAINVWLKMDTGMHRLGIQPAEFRPLLARLKKSAAIKDEIVCATHLSCADGENQGYTAAQIARFDAQLGEENVPTSIANSAAVLAWPDAHRDWIRPGYMLYGNSPFAGKQANAQNLRPAMTVVSQVTALRDISVGDSVGYGAAWTAKRTSKIATVPIGYGDGYPWHAPNGTPVMVEGQRGRLVGRVSMDMITVDVTDIPSVTVGSPVELWGLQLPVGEVARHAGTIGYELLTRLPARLRREYVDSAENAA